MPFIRGRAHDWAVILTVPSFPSVQERAITTITILPIADNPLRNAWL
jgi:hypothetical protein